MNTGPVHLSLRLCFRQSLSNFVSSLPKVSCNDPQASSEISAICIWNRCRDKYDEAMGPAYLFPQPHDLEAFEVTELLPPVACKPALLEGALVPLALDLLCHPLFLQGRVTGAKVEVRNDDACEGHVGELGGVAWHGGFGLFGRPIYEDLQMG